MLLHSFLDYWAREQPDAEFAVQDGQRTTYGQALDAANRLANAFLGAGLQLGIGSRSWPRTALNTS
jgi:hypothetical protein